MIVINEYNIEGHQMLKGTIIKCHGDSKDFNVSKRLIKDGAEHCTNKEFVYGVKSITKAISESVLTDNVAAILGSGIDKIKALDELVDYIDKFVPTEARGGRR